MSIFYNGRHRVARVYREMSKKAKAGVVGATIAIAIGGTAIASFAQTGTTATLVTAKTVITNEADTSTVNGQSYGWAMDDVTRTLVISQDNGYTGTVPSGDVVYTAVVTDKGEFHAVTGQLTPNQVADPGVKISNPVTGKILGQTVFTVFAPAGDALTGNVPASENFDYEQPSGNLTLNDWPELAFASVTGVSYAAASPGWDSLSYSYGPTAAGQTWLQTNDNAYGQSVSAGDITGLELTDYLTHGKVIADSPTDAEVQFSFRSSTWPANTPECVYTQTVGYDFGTKGSPHIGFTCTTTGTDVGYLSGLHAGHTYALRIIPAAIGDYYGDPDMKPLANAQVDYVDVVTTK